MTIFKPDKANRTAAKQKGWLIYCIVSLLPVIYDLLFPNDIIKDSYFFIALSVLVIDFFRIIFTERLLELRIDTERRCIIFLTKSAISKAKQKLLLFDNAVVEKELTKFRWPWSGDSIILWFLQTKMEVFEIRPDKDGYSPASLEAICAAAAAIPLPVKEI